MNSKKNLFLPFILTLAISLSGCFVLETAHAAKAKISDAVSKKGKISKAGKPNIVIVITDDQGYGDLGCTGNPIIKTPHTDKLANESVWLTDYHVAPTCSPTRAALMSGHWTNRTGVWHTIMGRSMLREDEGTLGQFFQDAGYRTGMFGKWHLGDNFPYRPEDRGFEEVYRHGGGGVGQTPDVWDNSYFDGGYFHNGEIVEAKGFCTDVFFEQANRFITESAKSGKPFLAYISTNAPHGPFHCPQKYMDLYEGQSPTIQAFYGMITNIDENVGKTRDLLKDLGVYKNTIFIFTTDNGTARGREIFNAGMRGQKGSEYDGGHRVPFFLHWPAGKMVGGRDVPELAAHLDVLPTLQSLCGLQSSSHPVTDGVTLLPVLRNGQQKLDRNHLIIQYHGGAFFRHAPEKWTGSVVLTDRWRLLDGRKLYDLRSDPAQRVDVAGNHPRIVQRLRDHYDPFWSSVSPRLRPVRIDIGNPAENPTRLCSQDWYLPNGNPPWNFNTINFHFFFSINCIDHHVFY